jgi:penicillin-binding protein 1C
MDEGSAEARDAQLISPGAAWLTLDMLKDVQRPGVESYWENFSGREVIAWKTGTSYGQRDAWAAGVSPEWTIVVWAGNFTGGENPNLRSTSSAGFLLFDIFNALSEGRPAGWFKPPLESLTPVETCRVTGYRAGPDCLERTTVLAPRGHLPLAECPWHRGIFVTSDGRFRVDSRSRQEGRYRRVPWLVYPPELAQFLRSAGTPSPALPPPASGYEEDEPALAILYPQNKARFFLPRELDGNLQKLALRAAHRDGRRRLYWYVDDIYLGATIENHVMFHSFKRGQHSLTVVDEQGQRAMVEFFTDLKEEKR